MRYTDRSKGPATIVRSIEARIQNVNAISTLRIGVDSSVVPCALTKTTLFIYLGPRFPPILGSKHASIFGFDNCPNSIGIRGGNRNTTNADRTFWQTRIPCDVGPCVTT